MPDILGLQGVTNLGTLQALATRINSDTVTKGTEQSNCTLPT